MMPAAVTHAALLGVLMTQSAFAQVFVGSLFENIDLGNIASDGADGRQIQIRPQKADDIGRKWNFFPPHDLLPESFPDPTPATPAHAEIFLRAGTPLVLALPELQHFPQLADVSVSHVLNAHEINVEASILYSDVATDTIYGPHEYLYPLGSLDAGPYRLVLNVARSSDFAPAVFMTTTGYVDFLVHPVPEPGTLTLASLCALLVVRPFGPRRTRMVKGRAC